MLTGKTNVVTGFAFLALFMLYGFVLIFLRDFAPGKEQWIADYAVGTHFESRLAHVHGNLFALINIAVGLALSRAPDTRTGRWISALALLGLLMPLGILAEVLFGAPPILVMAGGISMVAAMIWTAVHVWQTETFH
ncbi:MAG TPA: hypothetical protein PLZ16_05630 [Gammaproteobacteria bacterium]|nr:hypothetical protein [Gammaproteobacteria bacterium]